jgi:hypothetical protein
VPGMIASYTHGLGVSVTATVSASYSPVGGKAAASAA